MEDLTNGRTCADCQYCVEVKKHPRNNLKGGMHEHMGFACLLFQNDDNIAVFMDHADGFCECFTEKEVVNNDFRRY